ncbi:unnamed protein product, partial [Cuscuta epithymum]
MGVRDALLGAAEAGWSHVEVITDALSAVQGLKNEGGSSCLFLILNDIRHILKDKSNFIVSFCKRSANRVAHALARAHVTISDQYCWYDSIPDSIVSLLAHDL